MRRRRFLGGLGATGLTAAAVMFGRPEAAQAAVAWRCCHLCQSPSISLSTCKSYSGHYLWYCNAEARIQCQCCETKSGGCPTGVRSAGGCFYT
ncbi:hypothetical protein [Nonomuraea africana]|uniref:Twin-arginine translocation signal domain-containing protein n=1 Tax=Nonomuraea africana TaxID=46171 RepID=A0ABR9KIV3_9ACTN|nr:hypothetical protein [Nonomuraea africana]MBE1561953.1 hypothetical protein [Nonomuraea africana]